MDAEEAAVRRTALIVLGVVLVAAIAGLVAVATTTDRAVTTAARGVVIGLVLIALTGGAVLVWGPRKRGGSDDDGLR